MPRNEADLQSAHEVSLYELAEKAEKQQRDREFMEQWARKEIERQKKVEDFWIKEMREGWNRRADPEQWYRYKTASDYIKKLQKGKT